MTTPSVTEPTDPPATLPLVTDPEATTLPETTTPANGGTGPAVPAQPAKPAPPKTAKEQLSSADKKKAVEALATVVTDLDQDLADFLDDPKKDFESIVKDAGFEVKQSEFFSKENPPEELSAFIQNKQIGKVADAAFILPAIGDPDEKIDVPYQTNDGWFIVRLDEVQSATPLSYEQAKEQVLTDLKKEMAREQMIKDVEELEEKLAKALEAGKSFDEAAKELEKTPTEVTDLGEGQTFNFSGRSQKLPDPPEFLAAQFTNPGEIAPVEYSPTKEDATRATIIYVSKREVVKDAEYQTGIDNRYKSISGNMRFLAFSNWLYDRFLESDVVPPKLPE